MAKFFKDVDGAYINLENAERIYIGLSGESVYADLSDDNYPLYRGTQEQCVKYLEWLHGELDAREYREMDTEFPRGVTWEDLQNLMGGMRRQCRWGAQLSFEEILERIRPFFPRVAMLEQREAVRRTLHVLVLKAELTWDAKTGVFGLPKEETEPNGD